MDVCTLTFAWRLFTDVPLVVAANRDESYDRPSDPPSVMDDTHHPAVLAPQDRRAGGTWMGYNAAGRFVGLTNRWASVSSHANADHDTTDDERRSRGQLVADLLTERGPTNPKTAVENAVDRYTYNGFNLLIADVGWSDDRNPMAIMFEWDGTLQTTQIDPGVHVIVNVGMDDTHMNPEDTDRDAAAVTAQTENARRIRDQLSEHAHTAVTAGEWRSQAADTLRDHEFGVCVHNESQSFGTVSGSLITLHTDQKGSYYYADGPPCTTMFERIEATLQSENDSPTV